MLRPGWTDTLLRTALLVLGASLLNGCATGGSTTSHVGAPVGAPTGATSVTEPPSPELQARYASLLNRLQDDDPAAIADLNQFSKENPELAGPLLSLGLIHARDGDEAGARALFERASTVCSHCAPVWNALGVLDRQQGQFAAAEQAYVHAVLLEPNYALAYYNLAVLYELYIPRPDLALENYEHYLQISGPSGDEEDVEKWAADLRRRVGVTPKTASTEGPS